MPLKSSLILAFFSWILTILSSQLVASDFADDPRARFLGSERIFIGEILNIDKTEDGTFLDIWIKESLPVEESIRLSCRNCKCQLREQTNYLFLQPKSLGTAQTSLTIRCDRIFEIDQVPKVILNDFRYLAGKPLKDPEEVQIHPRKLRLDTFKRLYVDKYDYQPTKLPLSNIKEVGDTLRANNNNAVILVAAELRQRSVREFKRRSGLLQRASSNTVMSIRSSSIR